MLVDVSMSDPDAQPITSLGRHGNNHFAIGGYISLANGIVQLQRASFLTAIKVVSVKQSRQDDSYFTTGKVLAVQIKSEKKWVHNFLEEYDLTRHSSSIPEKRQ